MLWVALGGGVAHAGSYRVLMCETPTGLNVPTEGVSLEYSGPVWIDNRCGMPGQHVGVGLASGRIPSGTYAAAHLHAPDGLRIGAASVTREVAMSSPASSDRDNTPNSVAFIGALSEQTGYVVDEGTWCRWFLGCRGEGPRTVSWSAPGGVADAYWASRCTGEPTGWCDGAATANTSRLITVISSFDLTMLDDKAPTRGDASMTGSAVTGATHSGVEDLRAAVRDVGSGVSSGYVTLDGTVVGRWGSSGSSCQDAGELRGAVSYFHLVPCALAEDMTLSVDTRLVADGDRRLEVHAVDASGNDASVNSARITVNNTPAPKPLSAPVVLGVADAAPRVGDRLKGVGGSWDQGSLTRTLQWQASSGGGWTDIAGATLAEYTVRAVDLGHELRVVERVSNGQESAESASASTRAVQSGETILGQSLGQGDGSAQLVLDREQRTVQVAYGARVIVTGRLLDTQGQPIADAQVEVFEQLAVAGARWVRAGTVLTDGQGGYAFRPSTTGSRTLRFAYAGQVSSGNYRATRDVVVAVSAQMLARAVRKSVPVRGVIRLRGSVGIAPLPSTGAWVEIQVSDGGVWRTIATVRADAQGRWRFRHRLQGRDRVSFSFRARLRAVSDVPSTESSSRPVRVRVR